MTTRREFLKGLGGLFAGIVLAKAPTTVLDAAITDEWKNYYTQLLDRYMTEFMTYGTAAIKYTPEYPFVVLVTAQELLLIPEMNRAEGDF